MRFDFIQLGNLLEHGDLLEIQDGNHGELHPKASDYVKDGIPFVMASNLRNGKVDVGNCSKIPASIYKKLRIGFAKPGDILLSHKGTVGEVAVVDDSTPELMLTPQVTYYRPAQNSRRLASTFLYQVFRSPLFQGQLQKVSAQSTRAYVGVLAQRKLTIPLPSLGEQKKIAEILSTWDRAIELTQLALDRATDYFNSLQLMLLSVDNEIEGFEWESFKVGDLAEFINGHGFKQSDWSQEGEPIIRIQNLNGGRDFNLFSGTLPDKFRVKKGDLLFSWSGSRGTSFGPFIWDYCDGWLNQHIFNVKVKNKDEKEFIYFALLFVTRQIEYKAHGSAGLVHVTKSELEKFPIHLPKDAQKRKQVASLLKLSFAQVTNLKRQRDCLSKQKQGLMQKLLTGKARVKV